MSAWARVAAALCVLTAAAGAITAYLAPRPRVPDPTATPTVRVVGPRPEPTADLAPQVLAATSRNPFRSDRLPPSPRYEEVSESAPDDVPVVEAGPPPRLRPVWVLTGIVWGTEPVAVFEIAGEGTSRVLGEGEGVGELVVRDIGPDSVAVAHGDTAWTFVVTPPWKRGGTG